MQLKVEGLNLDDRAEFQITAGSGVDFASALTTQGDVTLTLGAPGANLFLPTGALAANMPRLTGINSAVQSTLSSGTLLMTAISLPLNITLNSITYVSGTTSASGPTNQIFGLYDGSRNLLRATANDGATAWNASTAKTLTLTSPYTTLYDGLYYTAILVTVSTTIPTLIGFTHSASTIVAIPPIVNGTSNTGLTTSLPNPANAITGTGAIPWAYVS